VIRLDDGGSPRLSLPSHPCGMAAHLYRFATGQRGRKDALTFSLLVARVRVLKSGSHHFRDYDETQKGSLAPKGRSVSAMATAGGGRSFVCFLRLAPAGWEVFSRVFFLQSGEVLEKSQRGTVGSPNGTDLV
jgi:hypothetical protein